MSSWLPHSYGQTTCSSLLVKHTQMSPVQWLLAFNEITPLPLDEENAFISLSWSSCIFLLRKFCTILSYALD